MSANAYEIEFRWKKRVIHWEGSRGVVFPGGWGIDPPVTVDPDSVTWDRKVPAWLRGRHDQVVARLRDDQRHDVREERDDSRNVHLLDEVER
jgi:hypothetical protein